MKKALLFLSLILMFTVNLYSVKISYTYYVNYCAPGFQSGNNWANAFWTLQAALDVAVSGDQIWVATGTYKPSSYYDLTNTSRYYHFRMKPGVAIYGGFAGTETLVSERINYGVGQANETILSGDLNDNGKDDNDCYHVFYHPTGLGLTSSAVLDGFTIKGGNANSADFPHYCGGGMYNYSNSPTINNCTFSSNSASYYGGGLSNNNTSSPTVTNCTFSSNSAYNGGGIYDNTSCSPTITNCIFSSNSATTDGGGIYNNNSSSPTVTNCTFSSNSANVTFGSGGGMANGYCASTITNCTFSSNSASNGGAMMNYESSPTITNCTFTLNSASNGGAMNNSSNAAPVLNNCIVWGNDATANGDEFYIEALAGNITTLNYSCYANASGDIYINGGSFTATNNDITLDPLFVGSTKNPAHPYSIIGISPCVDAGNDSYNSQTYDIRGAGYSRKLDKTTGGVGTIDMGAYEYKLNDDSLTVDVTSFTAQKPEQFSLAQNYPNPFNPSTTFHFALPVAGEVKLVVLNILGQEVAEVVNKHLVAGTYDFSWNASNLSSGIYFFKLTTNQFSSVRKMLMIK